MSVSSCIALRISSVSTLGSLQKELLFSRINLEFRLDLRQNWQRTFFSVSLTYQLDSRSLILDPPVQEHNFSWEQISVRPLHSKTLKEKRMEALVKGAHTALL